MALIGNREADLYRMHVLVKAILEQGDADTAIDLVEKLAASTDDDERVYAAWLRVWFDLDEQDADYRTSRSPRLRCALEEGELLDGYSAGAPRRAPRSSSRSSKRAWDPLRAPGGDSMASRHADGRRTRRRDHRSACLSTSALKYRRIVSSS